MRAYGSTKKIFDGLFLGIVAVISCACVYRPAWTGAPPTVSPLPPAVITFSGSAFDLGGLQWMEEQAVSLGVHFGADLLALDQNTAFLYGGLRVPAGTLRSLLLRTDDGGAHWQEVMEPVRGSSIEFISFLDETEGWALALWEVEGAGPIVLYHTQDRGMTWEKQADIPKWQWYGYPINLTFSEENHGEIVMIYDAGLPETNRVAFLTSIDGGITWQETSSIPLGDPREETFATTIAPYTAPDPLNESIGADESLWRVSAETGASFLLVSRRLPDGTGETVHAVPSVFKYADGTLSLP